MKKIFFYTLNLGLIHKLRDGKISPEEEKRAIEILRKADEQRDELQQKNVHSFFKNNL